MHVRDLVAIAACGVLTAAAQTPTPPANTLSVSLQECIDMALSRNLDLQIEHLSTDIAGYSLSGAYGAYVPTISFQARHDFVSQPGDFAPHKVNLDFPYDLTTDTEALSITGRLPTGLSYDFSGVNGEKHAITDFSTDPEDGKLFFWGIRDTNNSFASARVTATQHLLKDFWIDQDRLTLILARKNVKISQQALRFQVMRTVLAVELGYYDLIAARERIRVEEQALKLKEQFVAETRRRVEVGDLPPLDTDQAETQLQNTLTALSAAREAYASLENGLKSLLTDNFREWVDTELVPTDTLLAIPAEVNRSQSFQSALKSRPDIAEARLAVEKNDAAVQFRMNQLFPNLDLIGRYGGLAVERDSGTAMSQALHFRDPEYYYGVVVSLPFSNIAERNSYKASKAAKKVAELQLKKAEDAVLLQVADWTSRVQLRYTQVGSTRKARGYAESALVAEQKKLQNGMSTSFVVLQLQETLVAAQVAEAQALADYNKALAQLQFADATNLEKHRLKVEMR